MALIGVVCPECLCQTSDVVNSRPKRGGAIWRRRRCVNCKHRFTTYETTIKPLTYREGACTADAPGAFQSELELWPGRIRHR